MKKVVIVAAIRTPIGTIGGTLRDFLPEQLISVLIQALPSKLHQSEILGMIDEVIIGQTKQTTDAPNIARVAALLAGIPERIPAYSVHRQCASGMQAILNAVQQIQTGYSEIVLAGGVESMSTAPFYLRNARFGLGNGNTELLDPNTESQPKSQPESIYGSFNMIQTADNIATRFQITRFEQDQFALGSQAKAAVAIDKGYFEPQIVPVLIQNRKEQSWFAVDEYPRRDTNMEKLSKLKPIFVGGSVTAGNASGRNDGACILLLMSANKAQELGLPPLATFLGASAVGVDPKYMGLGPIDATQRLLKRINISINDFDLFEVNEAFASQTIACYRELSIPLKKLNVNGGAISLGHPLGCSGARIVTTLLHELDRRKQQLGLASICIAGGLGMAMAFRRE